MFSGHSERIIILTSYLPKPA